MRILFFSQNFEPEIGAGPQRIYAHTRRWVRDGNEVVVVTGFPSLPYGNIYKGYKNQLFQKEIIDGVTVHRLFTIPAGKTDRLLIRGIGAAFYALFSIFVTPWRFKPDVVCGSVPYLASLPAFLAAKIFRVPFVCEMRDPWLQVLHRTGKMGMFSKLIYRLSFSLERFIVHRADKVVVIGHEMADMIQDTYKLREKPDVVFNAVDTDVLSASLADNDNDCVDDFDGSFVVGFIGNMGSQYDLDVILKAADLLRDESCTFVFVGEGSMKQSAMDKASAGNLSNVRFFDLVPYKEALKWIRRCDVTVIPLRSDEIYKVYLSLKAMDSMAVGSPILVSSGGELARIVENSGSGAVFEVNCHQGLADLITERMRNPAILEDERKAGTSYVKENLTRDKMAKKCLELFSTLVSNN